MTKTGKVRSKSAAPLSDPVAPAHACPPDEVTAPDVSEVSATPAKRATSKRVRSKKSGWEKRRTRELFRRYKEEGDLAARDKLVQQNERLVISLVNRYLHKGIEEEDLRQVGFEALLKAIERFDPTLGLEFSTYATPTITGEIKRYFRDKGWSVRVPRRLQELSDKVNKASEALSAELMRSPSAFELAEHLGVTVDEVLEAMESSLAYSVEPLESQGDDEDDQPRSVIDRYSVDKGTMEASDNRTMLDAALRDLSPREREVLELRYQKEMTQTQIAEALGISQVQVSRMLRRTLKRLQERFVASPSGEVR